MNADLINPYQRNSIAVTLRMLEMALRKNLSHLDSAQNGILYRQKASLSTEQQEQLRRLSSDALSEIAALARELALPVEIQSNSSEMQSQLFELWGDMHEIRSKELRAYGEVSPDLGDVLDPHVETLIDVIWRLLKVLEGK